MKTLMTRDGIAYSIRNPVEADANRIIEFAKVLFASTDQVLTTPEEYQMTTADEIAWIRSNTNQPGKLLLIAITGDRVIGLLDFAVKPRKKIQHTGELGLSVHPAYQGKGIGRALLRTLIEWAQKNPMIEKVILNVLVTNEPAIHLYKSLGFIEECRQIRAVKQPDGRYVDMIQMYVETGGGS